MTTKDYILKIAKNRGVKAFIIKDTRGDIRYVMDEPHDHEYVYNDLMDFLDNNSGNYKIELRSDYGLGIMPQVGKLQKCLIGEYEVYVNADQKNNRKNGNSEERTISGFGGISGHGLSVIKDYEREMRQLQNDLQSEKLERLSDKYKYESQISDLNRQLTDAKSSDVRINGMLTQLSSIMSPTMNRAVNGISNNSTNMSEDDKRNKIVDAMNRLVKADPNFSENISKLANLVETKPDIYKMAVAQLNSL